MTSKGARLRELAADLDMVAAAYDVPSRSIVRAETLIAQVESIAADIKAVVRGRR